MLTPSEPYHQWRGFDETCYPCEAVQVPEPSKLRFEAKFIGGKSEIELAPGLRMPETATATVYDWDGFTIKLRIDLVDGRYRCVDLHLLRSGEEITGESLRQIPVARFVSEIITTIAEDRWDLIPAPDAAERGLTKEALLQVARIYRLAHAVGAPPTQRVAEAFHLKPSTAGRWVSRAREARFLEPAAKPGKAGG